jgi:hypothetical protein
MKDYIIVQRSKDKKWYVVGHTGYKNTYMPISNGMKSKCEAEKYASIQKKVDKLAPCGL